MLTAGLFVVRHAPHVNTLSLDSASRHRWVVTCCPGYLCVGISLHTLSVGAASPVHAIDLRFTHRRVTPGYCSGTRNRPFWHDWSRLRRVALAIYGCSPIPAFAVPGGGVWRCHALIDLVVTCTLVHLESYRDFFARGRNCTFHL